MKKQPPQAVLERMGRGGFNALVSMCCLGAAMGIKRGQPVTRVMPIGEDWPKEQEALLLQTIADARKELEAATPEQLDAAITLYEAHLRFCGYQIEAGVAN